MPIEVEPLLVAAGGAVDAKFRCIAPGGPQVSFGGYCGTGDRHGKCPRVVGVAGARIPERVDGTDCAQRAGASRIDVEDIDSQSDPAGFDETVKYDAEVTAHVVDGLFEPAGLLVRVRGHEKCCDAAPFDNSSGVEGKAGRDCVEEFFGLPVLDHRN